MPFELRSSAFKKNEVIPRKFTCDGSDVSIPLSWSDPPEGTKSLALIADDPDAPAGVWVHWVLYDLPSEMREISEAVPREVTLERGGKQGKNDFGKIGYGGPCPPRGPVHRYFFKMYALDRMTGLQPRATKKQLIDAMKGHILAEAELVGTYKR